MVTEYRELPWDTFLLKDVSKEGALSKERLDAIVAQRRANIASFRRIDWPNIRRQLYQAPHNWELPEGLEPHWVDAGRAIMWQRLVIRQPVEKDDGRRVIDEVDHGWQPTGGGLPLNNASQIAHYLGKGFRLRPPVNGVDEKAFEAAVPSEVLQAEPKAEKPIRLFKCDRHGRRRSAVAFKTWKAYTRHCYTFQESIEEEMPAEVLEIVNQHEYFCQACGKGFKNRTGAYRHMRSEFKKPGKRLHPGVDDMEVASYANKD